MNKIVTEKTSIMGSEETSEYINKPPSCEIKEETDGKNDRVYLAILIMGLFTSLVGLSIIYSCERKVFLYELLPYLSDKTWESIILVVTLYVGITALYGVIGLVYILRRKNRKLASYERGE